jgi:hypothetical protein
MDRAATDTIRGHALMFLRTVEDRTQAREVRAFACKVVDWALYFGPDEQVVTEILGVLRRAIDRDDEPPLLLLHALGPTASSDPGVSAGLLQLGEHALELGRTCALARIIRTLAGPHRVGPSGETVRASARWIRALVGTASPDDVSGEVLSAVGPWLRDKHGDVESVRDMLGDPDAWINAYAQRL